jgi:transcriptional regulator with XRE-family HTH domain
MISATTIRAKRTAAGIVGQVLCRRCGIGRTRLSDIERGYVTAAPEELARLDSALDELIKTKSIVENLATSMGWPSGGMHDR